MRYVKEPMEAEDVLVQGFFKIFKKIDQYQDKGSFEGWMKKIMVNESLMFLRQRKNFHLSLQQDEIDIPEQEKIQTDIQYKELISLLDQLPVGYRTVFNLNVIEGYKHREIAEKLDISINTSKSQLIQAKKKLQSIIKKKHGYKSGTNGK